MNAFSGIMLILGFASVLRSVTVFAIIRLVHGRSSTFQQQPKELSESVSVHQENVITLDRAVDLGNVT
jgi:hypothetical protein